MVGWIYCEDTPINFPVVQAEDNDYYLRRLIDGTWNSSGTLFVDYRNADDFSDSNTIIYGHNMKNKGMFGTLPNYKEQSYYDDHPLMWLLTPDGNYKVELIAGYVTSSTSEIYSFGQTEEEVFALAEQSIEKSTFTSDFQVLQGDRFVTLSTCSYEYDNPYEEIKAYTGPVLLIHGTKIQSSAWTIPNERLNAMQTLSCILLRVVATVLIESAMLRQLIF